MELFTYEFGRIALIGGMLSATATAMLGNLVVLRKMAFLGSGVAHLAFVGVGLGLLLGKDPKLMTIIVATASAVLLGYLAKKGIHEDIGIGVLFSTSMALGMILVSISKVDTSRVMAFLFGDILAMGWGDVALLGVLTAIVLVFCAVFREHLVYATFDEDFAKILGIKINAVYYTFLVLLAISIVLAINMLGIILVSAMIVVPAATSMMLARTYQGMFKLSPVISTAAVFLGLILSWEYDMPSSAAVVVVQGALFFLAFLARVLGR